MHNNCTYSACFDGIWNITSISLLGGQPMRIISQNGAIDVPYDYFSLTIATGKYEDVEVACIYCHNLSSPKGTKLAEYSSKEKAEKAMEMLREKYKDYAKATNKSNFFTMFDYPKVFQFPQDEDVEV